MSDHSDWEDEAGACVPAFKIDKLCQGLDKVCRHAKSLSADAGGVDEDVEDEDVESDADELSKPLFFDWDDEGSTDIPALEQSGTTPSAMCETAALLKWVQDNCAEKLKAITPKSGVEYTPLQQYEKTSAELHEQSPLVRLVMTKFVCICDDVCLLSLKLCLLCADGRFVCTALGWRCCGRDLLPVQL